MTDRLPEIKARRGAVPDPPYEIEDTVTEEEFYMRWRLIHYGPPDEDGWRDWWAAVPHAGAKVAEFIANAPADIDWLVGKVERLRQGDEFSRMHAEMVGLHRGFEVKEAEVQHLRGLLGYLEWASCNWDTSAVATCPACRRQQQEGHGSGCALAAALGRVTT